MTLLSATDDSATLLPVLGLEQPVAALETDTLKSCYDGDSCRKIGG